jgi:two-component system phosphate regulon response regulator PhoB
MASILVVEDETDLREMLAETLSSTGDYVRQAESISVARKHLSELQPDLIILDWMLPDVTGLQWLRQLRRDTATSNIPVIMLTAKDTVEDRVSGLDSGADDYLVKPFSIKELQARVRTQLRKVDKTSDARFYHVDGLTLDVESHRVTGEHGEIRLGPTEFRLLEHFMSHPERVYSRGQLLDAVWGQNIFIEERTVDVHIRRLRKALSTHNIEDYVQTVRGAGYRFGTSKQQH